MTNYRTYGFCVASSFVLPELVRVQCAAEVPISRGTAGHVPNAAVSEDGHEVSEDDVRLSFEGVGAFRIRGGREIVVEPEPGVDEAIVRLSLLGPALAVLLHQRGFLVLHASCVAMDGAVAFLGDSEWGKSTTAAALYRSGRPLVADDVVAVDLQSGSPMVRRAFPQLKLWPESVEALGIQARELRTIHPDLEKRAFRAQVGFGDDDL
ncbi:MAG: serine kinase, partial [Actinomycetota bacterium]|nr:serine kinase [Actinomycetota bacterium]